MSVKRAGRKVKRRITSLILALLLLGTMGVMADVGRYSFELDLYDTTAFSEGMARSSSSTAGWVQQTGASAGGYTTAYCIVRTTANYEFTPEVQIGSTDYSTHTMTYAFHYGDVAARLRGRHTGSTIGAVMGIWSPNNQ